MDVTLVRETLPGVSFGGFAPIARPMIFRDGGGAVLVTRVTLRFLRGMSADLFLAFLGFAIVGTATPGPNNLMIMASGANYGLRRSLPHLFGIGFGFAVLLFAVGLGMAALFEAVPILRPALAVVSVGYMLWLAWKIATAGAPEGQGGGGQPMTALQAAAFQWVNPKAWTMGLGAITLYTGGSLGAVTVVALTFWFVSIPVLAFWAVMGIQARRWLGAPGRLRAFNWTMATVLVASLWPTLAPLF